jgi:hypothetical protein
LHYSAIHRAFCTSASGYAGLYCTRTALLELLIQQFSLLLRWVNTYFCRSVHNECSAIISLYYIFLFRHFDILAARLGGIYTTFRPVSNACPPHAGVIAGLTQLSVIVICLPPHAGVIVEQTQWSAMVICLPPHAGVIVEQTQWSAMVICLPPHAGAIVGLTQWSAIVICLPPHAGVLANCCFCKK